ncbi:hypothetical protein QQS21_006552 [Conoideocrella luteorostrata]|uniref:DNA (cytosine-5)-methyltransferase 1 replication foci domain-containing protein n=1 Tax=Conoideocrella luteorostrata TaxID=1105319 RepID=A0AAJ0CQ40_9HYPO|nr:hypothetical protein QQS21_006552 [Conoideocrella luteorostrata]
MPGHRPRASTSSVESVDESETRWRQETSVVRSVPTDTPSDDWPIFELANAAVLNKDGQTFENALQVGLKGPFIVRGDLIIDDPIQKSHLIMRVRSTMPLEIRRSALYSIGESKNGRPLIWVSGQGGWYEIEPCRAYKPMYNKMCEATTMYYCILDIYTENPPKKTKKAKNCTLVDELAQYAARIGDGSTFEEVMMRANEHAAFFIDKFANNDGLDWTATAFYKWIKSENVELWKQVYEAQERARQQPYESDVNNSSRVKGRSSSVKSSSVVDVIDDAIPAQNQNQRKARRSKSTTPRTIKRATPESITRPAAPDEPPAVVQHYTWTPQDNDRKSPFRSILDPFEDLFQSLASKKNGMTLSSTLSQLYFSYSFLTYKDGSVGAYKQPVKEILHYYSRALLQVLGRQYRDHEIYGELQGMARTEFRPRLYKPHDFPFFLTARKSQPKKPSTGNLPSLPILIDDGPSASDTPKPRGKYPARTPGKSSLRPVSRAPKKRLRDEFERDHPNSASSPAGKKSLYFGDDDSLDRDMDDITGIDSEEDSDDDNDSLNRSRDKADPYDLEPIKLVIRAEKMPTSSPRGPHNTWTCEQEGCDYIVRGGDEQDCQTRIRQHFQEHEQQLKRVNLAMSEAARGHMSVKYAYFPPFLILVYFEPPLSDPENFLVYPSPPLHLPPSLDTSAPPMSSLFKDVIRPPYLSGLARDNFSAIVESFRRTQHPVSDRIGSLTCLQSFTRQDQTDTRQGGCAAADGEVDKEEVDSVTLCSENL